MHALMTRKSCAEEMCNAIASSAPANERVHVHNERNFPQAKLGGEINALFLLTEHGDLYFLA